mmetsp:Transcript_6230/g.15367  ORF Transcript_6230/g.15367 Transcript_6230/m.15367 type:complete len:275 (-) Transcript_6230:23-847(-)
MLHAKEVLEVILCESGQCTGIHTHSGLEQKLLFSLQPHYPLLYCVGDDKASDNNRPELTESVYSVHCLLLRCWIPPRIHDEHSRRDSEVKRYSSSFQRDKKYGSVGVGSEGSDSLRPLENIHSSIQFHTFEPGSTQTPVDHVQKIDKLREDNALDVRVFFSHTYQLFQQCFQLGACPPIFHIRPIHNGCPSLSSFLCTASPSTYPRTRCGWTGWGPKRGHAFLIALLQVHYQLLPAGRTPQDVVVTHRCDVQLHAASTKNMVAFCLHIAHARQR